MAKKTFILASLVSFLPCLSLSAADLALPKEPAAVEVPAVPAATADTASLQSEYVDIYSALKFYSGAAFAAAPGGADQLQASAYGQYLRARLEALGAAVARNRGVSREALEARVQRGYVSPRVAAELENVFVGSRAGVPAAQGRGVPIKQGYCQINYVKNNVPFLVQSDGFLQKGEVILTFDDGPGPLTEEVSAAMKAGNAPSLFFVLGSKLGEQGRARLKAEVADGHFAGVHGYNHATEAGKPFTALSTQETLKQLGGVNDSIAAATGKKSGFFRPPYGIISVEALKAIDAELGLVPVGWTIDTLDWSTKDPDVLFQKTIELIKQRGKGIVLMHDIHPQSRTAAKRLVGWLAENGYKVVSPERMATAFRGE
jgi:peptidoglycan/xylan/chitin deacetylase (PgdA/CDA1 family)